MVDSPASSPWWSVLITVPALALIALLIEAIRRWWFKKKPELSIAPAPVPDGRPRILIIDDDRETLAAIRLFLNGDYEVRSFEFEHDAVRKIIECHENHKGFDAAIIDYNLKRITGPQITAFMRSLLPKTKIAYLSGGASFIPDRERKKVNAVWGKPIHGGELQEKLAALLIG